MIITNVMYVALSDESVIKLCSLLDAVHNEDKMEHNRGIKRVCEVKLEIVKNGLWLVGRVVEDSVYIELDDEDYTDLYKMLRGQLGMGEAVLDQRAKVLKIEMMQSTQVNESGVHFCKLKGLAYATDDEYDFEIRMNETEKQAMNTLELQLREEQVIQLTSFIGELTNLGKGYYYDNAGRVKCVSVCTGLQGNH